MKALHLLLCLASGLLALAASGQTLSNYHYLVTAQSPDHYFKLDGTLNDAVDPAIVLESFGAGGFTFDTFRNNGDSYFYVNQTDFLRINGTTNLINGGGVSNTTSTAAGAITLLFRTLDPGAATGQRFIFSAGGSTADHNALLLFLENTNIANGDPNSLKFRFGNTTTTILDVTNVAPNTWYYFALSYSETTGPNKATWYVGRPGGALNTGTTTNSADSVAGDGLGVLMIGNSTNLASGWRNPGNGQIDEFATWRRQLTPSEVNAQFSALPSRVPPSASAYQSLITSQSPSYYFKLDSTRSNSLAATPVLDVVGPSVGFTYDYFGNFLTTNAAAFTAVNDALVVSNNLVNGGGSWNGIPGPGKGTVTFLFNSLSGTNVSGQRFLFSAGGATANTNGFGVYMENFTATTDKGAIKVRLGNSSKPILQPQDIVLGEWYYCAVTYDESISNQQVNWYLGQPGGPLNSGTFDYAVGSLAGQGNIFVIGNHTNFNAAWRNPGTGRIDEFAIWPRVLSPTEVSDQFAALTPSVIVAPPKLSISLSSGNVIISWPSSTPATYALEVTNVLDSTTAGTATWPSAGSASIVSTNYIVTNSVSPGARFYRLHKP